MSNTTNLTAEQAACLVYLAKFGAVHFTALFDGSLDACESAGLVARSGRSKLHWHLTAAGRAALAEVK